MSSKRNQILNAAAKVFAANGFHPTTIRDVAREAGVADGTIYNYFDSKTALLFAILDRMRESAASTIDPHELAEMDFRGLVKLYVQQALFVPKADNFELFRVVMSEILVNKDLRSLYHERILQPALLQAEPLFTQWAEQHPGSTVDPALAVRALSGAVLGLIIQHILGDELLAARWADLPDALADLFIHGVGG
ncbi:MAG: TetR/AcrR family transcriptional regulator [Anaerolineae bacterium]|nr:TetR/AcrR family transcriptional regulator [Anaerolineae bacterium]